MIIKSKWFWAIAIPVIIFLALVKPYDYYSDNRRYANYVLQQWSAANYSQVEDGYTDRVSYHWGEISNVFVNGKKKKQFFLSLYDINGNKVDSVFTAIAPQDSQQDPSVLGYGYSITLKYKIPPLKGGIYLWEKKIPFLIKGRSSKIGVLYPTNTLNAYNISGGKSLYSIFSRQANEVSFLRPMFPYVSFQSYYGLKYFFNHKQYNFTYLADVDLDNIDSVKDLDVLIIAGHSEYWTRMARLNFDKFVDQGGHAIILSGNTMWWQIRYNENKSTMICYKSSEDSIDNPLLQTINWSDSSLQYPISSSIILDFEKGGYGRKSDAGYNGYNVTDPKNQVFKNISFDSLAILNIPTKEYDGVNLNFSSNPPKIVDNSGFQKVHLLGYDSIDNGFNGVFVMAKKNDSSGLIFNVGTMDWCSAYGLGGKDSSMLQTITDNMIDICLSDSSTNY